MLRGKDVRVLEKSSQGAGKGASSAGPQNPVAPAPISSSKGRGHQLARPQQHSAKPTQQTSSLEPVEAAEPQEKGCWGPRKVDTLQRPALNHHHQHQFQQQQGSLDSHALAAVCLSEDSSDNDCSTSIAAAASSQQGAAYPPARQPALHRRVPVRVHRGSSLNISSSSGSKQASSSDRGAASPPAAARAGSAVGSSRARAAQAKSDLKKGEPRGEAVGHVSGASQVPQDDAKASKLRAAAASAAIPTWSSWSKLAVLVSLLMAFPVTLWAVQSASTAASLLSALGKWARDGPQLAPISNAGGLPQFYAASSSSSSNSSPFNAAFKAASPASSFSGMGSPQHKGGSTYEHVGSHPSSTVSGGGNGLSSGMTRGLFKAGATQGGSPSSVGDVALRGKREVAAQTGTRDAAETYTPTYLPTIPPATSQQWDPEAAVRVAVVVGKAGTPSPYREAPWGEVLAHTAQRLQWTDSTFEMLVYDEAELAGPSSKEATSVLQSALKDGCQILVGVGVSEPSVVSFLQQLSNNPGSGAPGVRIFFESPPDLQHASSLQGWAPWGSKNPITAALEQLAPWSKPSKAAILWDTLSLLWQRKSSDDLLYVFLVLINEYVSPVKEVYMTTKGTGLKDLWCMVTNCGTQIKDCVTNPVCKAGLDCLQSCQFNDQICQYRCIVAHETPTFEEFALCILQKHNCRGLTAEMNMNPDHAPMSTFRGAPLTHEVAEDMLIGWMDPGRGSSPFSWLVAAGKNPAYDYFPCQHQLFSRGKGRGQMWYEPVFKVLLDNAEVWRRRRYRVRRASTPGTFHFSVLDNGVVSKEFWKILDADDALEWILLGYTGAASTAGLSYSGAVLGTRDGSYPTAPDALQRLDAALGKAGIKAWELSFVDNSKCIGAPL